jgi:hypothetical protein
MLELGGYSLSSGYRVCASVVLVMTYVPFTHRRLQRDYVMLLIPNRCHVIADQYIIIEAAETTVKEQSMFKQFTYCHESCRHCANRRSCDVLAHVNILDRDPVRPHSLCGKNENA